MKTINQNEGRHRYIKKVVVGKQRQARDGMI